MFVGLWFVCVCLSLFLLYPHVSHPAGLKDILHMVSSQWDQLQRQIRRQHGWMLRTVRCIQARLLYTSQSLAAVGDPSANQEAPCPADGLKVENFYFFIFSLVFLFSVQPQIFLSFWFIWFSFVRIPLFPLWLIPTYPPLSFYHTHAHSQINHTHVHSVLCEFLCVVGINCLLTPWLVSRFSLVNYLDFLIRCKTAFPRSRIDTLLSLIFCVRV